MSQKIGKNNLHVHLYKFILSVKQSTAENFVYGELVDGPANLGLDGDR